MRYVIRVSIALALLFWAMTLHARSQSPADRVESVQTQQPR